MDESEILESAVLRVAELMALSAKTAPKARGLDNIVVKIVRGEEKAALAAKMRELSSNYGDYFARDAEGVEKSIAVLVIGCRAIDMNLKGPDWLKVNPNLLCSLVNLGIALGSAAKTASLHNVDNRIMYSIGIAALEMRLLDADFAFGIPLSATSKNIFFDRKWPK